jgi:uncharacterized protein (TIGR02996 family)
MGDHAGFLADILANPDDDTHRLVYADWLEEHGLSGRAAFIRVQCRIAREPPFCVTGRPLTVYGEFTARCRCPGCSLRRREYMTSRRFIQWDWLGGVDSGFAPFIRPAGWRRGFVASVACRGEDWIRHGAAVLAAHPVEELRLSYSTHRLSFRAVLEAVPETRRLRRVSLPWQAPEEPPDYARAEAEAWLAEEMPGVEVEFRQGDSP